MAQVRHAAVSAFMSPPLLFPETTYYNCANVVRGPLVRHSTIEIGRTSVGASRALGGATVKLVVLSTFRIILYLATNVMRKSLRVGNF